MRSPAEAIVKAREVREQFVAFAEKAEVETGDQAAEAAKLAREWICQQDELIEHPDSLKRVDPKGKA